MSNRRVRQLVLAVLTLLTALAVPHRTAAQIDPDLVSIDLTQQPQWTGEVWPADFNRDGITDVTFLTTPAAGSALAWARGFGNGSFDAPQAIATGTGMPIGVGDVNSDGFTDIVTSSHIVPGRGDGTFTPPVSYASASQERPAPAQVVDMNGDGRADLVVFLGSPGGGPTTELTGRVSIYPGNGDFTFGAPLVFNAGYEAESMIVTDLNGDGFPDIANTSRDNEPSRLKLHINAGNGTFTTTHVPLAYEGGGLAARDMNGDGITDLIVGMGDWDLSGWNGFKIWSNGQVAVLLGLGGGAFAAPLTFPTLRGPIRVVIGDFNGDGIPDVATGNQTRIDTCSQYPQGWASVSVLLGRGDGTLAPPRSFAMGEGLTVGHPQSSVRRLNTSDLNADGRTDFLFTGGQGAVVLMKPFSTNRPPVANAGPDKSGPVDIVLNTRLQASATDPDHDWLTFEWRDQYGRRVGTGYPRDADSPIQCFGGAWAGTHEFTVIVRDGQGGAGTDTMLWTFPGPGPGPIPSGFTGENIGDVGAAPGTDSFSGGQFSVSGGGADIWGTADAFRFVHTSVTGDFDVVARVERVENLDPWTKGGLMIRERLTPGSRHAFAFATPTEVNGVAFQRREVENGESVHTSGPAQPGQPVWLRLVRQGDLIRAYHRTLDTEPWTLMGTQTLSGLSTTVYVGLAVTGHLDGTAATASFSNFAVTLAPTGPPSVEWQTGDVGSVAAAADMQFDGTTYTVRGSGADIWDNADAFGFAYVRAAGDTVMTVRVSSITGPHGWSKAGLMIRQTLAADSVHHYLLASAANGLAYQRRVATGDGSLHTALGVTTPAWFRIERHGGVIRLFYSTQSGAPSAWEFIAETPFPEGEVFVGLAVTSHADGALATGTFDHLSQSSTPVVAWTSADIGLVGIAGTDAFDGTTHTLTASGTDIWGTADLFHFKYVPLPADGSIVARVTSLNAGDPWAKAGLMIRSQANPSATHVFALVSRDNGVAFQWRPLFGNITGHTSGPAMGVPVWLRLIRNNGIVTAYVSVTGSNNTWTPIFSTAFSGPALVGLALTSHDNEALATATFDNVTVTRSP